MTSQPQSPDKSSGSGWFSGQPFVITPQTRDYQHYMNWRNRTAKRRNRRVDTRCHYYEVVAREWFLNQPIRQIFRPWSILLIGIGLGLFGASFLLYPGVTKDSLRVIAPLAILAVGLSLIVTAALTAIDHLEESFPNQAARVDRFSRDIKQRWSNGLDDIVDWLTTKPFAKIGLNNAHRVVIAIIAIVTVISWQATVVAALLIAMIASIAITLSLIAYAVHYLWITAKKVLVPKYAHLTGEAQLPQQPSISQVQQVLNEAKGFLRYRKRICPLAVIETEQ